ncbi:MAG: hypothetical protein CM15mP87_07500 [Candidatus Neomarinimicrobiota bacterium]|nr:MAG: hypothetical protein CM15mP87_07500 [Candidatus Neomarinimicrobiota bacterium]
MGYTYFIIIRIHQPKHVPLITFFMLPDDLIIVGVFINFAISVPFTIYIFLKFNFYILY